MRVLVTGGTGYLGSAIVAALRGAGHAPVIFARRARTAGAVDGVRGIEAIHGDVRNPGQVCAAVAATDAVVHAAAVVSLWRRRVRDFDEVNVDGLRHVIDACREAGRPLVYTSSFLALPPAGRATPLALNEYQRTKAAALSLARQAIDRGQKIVVVIPGVVYGPGPVTEGNLVGGLIRDHLDGRLPGLLRRMRPWSFAWREDVAALHVAALDRGEAGASYIAGGENASPIRIFELIRDATGRPLPRLLPEPLVRMAAAGEVALARLVGRPPTMTPGTVSIFGEDWSLDSAGSVAALGYRVTPLASGIRQILADGGA